MQAPHRTASPSRLAAPVLVCLFAIVVGSIGSAPLATGAGADETKKVTVDALSTTWKTVAKVRRGKAVSLRFQGGDATCHEGGAVDCPIGDPHGSQKPCSASGPNGDRNAPPGPAGDAIPYGALAGRVVGKDGEGTAFLLDSHRIVSQPGELQLVFNDCAGGYGDNAGSFRVLIEKKSDTVALSGHIRALELETAYHPAFLHVVNAVDRPVIATGKQGEIETATRTNGKFVLTVPEGRYKVRVPGRPGTVDPLVHNADASEGDVENLDFSLCAEPPRWVELGGGPIPCKWAQLSVQLVDVKGRPFRTLAHETGLGWRIYSRIDIGSVNQEGRTSEDLWVPRGNADIYVRSDVDNGVLLLNRAVRTPKAKNNATLKVPPYIGAEGAPKVITAHIQALPISAGFEITATALAGDDSCTSSSTQSFDNGEGDERKRSASLTLSPPAFSTFCSGAWKVSIYDNRSGKALSQGSFSVPG